jgi:EpsI family protein
MPEPSTSNAEGAQDIHKPRFPSPLRLWITVAVLLGAYVLLHTVSHGEPVVPHQHLRDLPYVMENWKGQEQQLPDQIVQFLGVSDHTNRIYFRPAEPPVQLYIGYYATQRTGDTMHSPKNCLPGAGWDPISAGYATVPLTTARQIVVNDYIIQKDLSKQMVLYWYQGRGRINASEYAGKFWTVADAISRNRTDGALVRLTTAMDDGEAKARTRLISFAQSLFPNLDAIIPR